ncbi:MAG TPA: hypothetical protein VEV81_07055 [Pyrinomonadaceae bacterium]|nr:hypothetical protein [Pyrinomonadaceae bacterium]
MSDSLSLSLWYPSFPLDEMLARAATVMRLFPFSQARPGITYLAVHPVSWSEPTVLERKFQPGIRPEEAALLAADLLHEDYAYVFDAAWDLFTPAEDRIQWTLQPSPVRFLVHGVEFDDAAFEQNGHIQVDFGLDSPFLQENVDLTSEAEIRVRANVQMLVDFTQKVETSSGASGRLLWSESEENLAQKLIARLQKVQ